MDIQFFYAGSNSFEMYRDSAPVLSATFNEAIKSGLQHGWDPKNNTLKILIATPKDIDPTEQYKSINWNVMNGCSSPVTKEIVDARSYLSEQSIKLYRIISENVGNRSAKPSDFSDAVTDNPLQMTDTISAVAYSVMSNNEASITFSKYVPYNGDPIVVFTLKDNPYDGSDNRVLRYSGLDKEYFENLNGSKKAYKINGIAHEFGHGILGHHTLNNNASKYDCIDLNFELSDGKVMQEGLADVIGGMALNIGAQRGLITPDDAKATAKEIEALRAFGNLYLSSDSVSLGNNTDVNIHLTTLIYDTTKPDFRANFIRLSTAKGVSAIPPLVNSLVNVTVGFVYAHKLSIDTKTKPRLFTKDVRNNFRTIGRSLNDNIFNFSDLGGRVKFGGDAEDGIPEIKKQPEFYVAAMLYLHETGGLRALRSQLKLGLRPAYDDLIKDFFDAIVNYGSARLLDPEVYALFTKTMPKNMDYNEMIRKIIKVSNSTDRVKHQGDTPVPRYILQFRPQ